MIQLTQEFVDACPEEKRFRLRGMDMTRIEVFVDAAFAFAVTMLVISFDAIPGNWEEMMLAVKTIPAFAVAVGQLVWIWHEHSVWSKRFGLDDSITVLLSTVLLIVVLVYIYPLRIMAAGFFSWMTNNYLPVDFILNSYAELGSLFVFLSIGFSTICLVFVLMYRYAARKKDQLLLSTGEHYEALTIAYFWAGAGVIGLICVLAATLLPPPWTPLAGFVYFLLAIWGPFIGIRRERRRPVPA